MEGSKVKLRKSVTCLDQCKSNKHKCDPNHINGNHIGAENECGLKKRSAGMG
jgi:hypothetical protein